MRILPPEFGGLDTAEAPGAPQNAGLDGRLRGRPGLGAAAVALPAVASADPPGRQVRGGLRPAAGQSGTVEIPYPVRPAAASARPSTLRAAGGPVRSAAVKKPGSGNAAAVTAPAATTPVARASLTASAVSTPTAAAAWIGGGLDYLLSVFRNGTAADPNAGLIMGNGFTFTADSCTGTTAQRRQRRTWQRRRRLQRRKRRCRRLVRQRRQRRCRDRAAQQRGRRNGGAAGPIAGNGGNGGAGDQTAACRHRRQGRIGRAVRQRR